MTFKCKIHKYANIIISNCRSVPGFYVCHFFRMKYENQESGEYVLLWLKMKYIPVPQHPPLHRFFFTTFEYKGLKFLSVSKSEKVKGFRIWKWKHRSWAEPKYEEEDHQSHFDFLSIISIALPTVEFLLLRYFPLLPKTWYVLLL